MLLIGFWYTDVDSCFEHITIIVTLCFVSVYCHMHDTEYYFHVELFCLWLAMSVVMVDVCLYIMSHTQPFYGSVEFVRENPGEPVPEETFTHYSHRSHQSSLSAFSI